MQKTDLQDIINYMKSYDFDESINNVERISKMLEDVHFVGDENSERSRKAYLLFEEIKELA